MARRFSPWQDLCSLLQLLRLFQRLSPDIVHAHTPKAGLLGMLASCLARVRVRIFHIHGLPQLTAQGMERRLLRLTMWLSCRLATRVLVVSAGNAALVAARGLCRPDKLCVPANGSIGGVDAEVRFHPARTQTALRDRFRARLDIPTDAFAVAFVGRLAVDKGLAELAEAWDHVVRQRSDAHLIVAGELDDRDPLPPAIRDRLLKQSSVHHVGWVQDTPAIYAAADLLVLPTYREGFGMVLLEAAAMALPVVASDVPGCRDAVINGRTGTLVPVRDTAALGAAILMYARDPLLRGRHGAAGRQRALQDFRPVAVRQAIADEYMRQLALPSGRRVERRLKRLLDLRILAATVRGILTSKEVNPQAVMRDLDQDRSRQGQDYAVRTD